MVLIQQYLKEMMDRVEYGRDAVFEKDPNLYYSLATFRVNLDSFQIWPCDTKITFFNQLLTARIIISEYRGTQFSKD